MYPIVSTVKWLTVFGRGEFCVGLDAEDNPAESLPEALRWLLVRLLGLGWSCGRRSEMLVQRLRSGSRRRAESGWEAYYFTAVVVVVMSAAMAKVSIWGGAGLPDRRPE